MPLPPQNKDDLKDDRIAGESSPPPPPPPRKRSTPGLLYQKVLENGSDQCGDDGNDGVDMISLNGAYGDINKLR